MRKIFLLVLYFLCATSFAHEASSQPAWYSWDSQHQQVTLRLELYVTSACPHCHKADQFFYTLEQQYPWLEVHRYFIDQDKLALKQFYGRVQALHENNFALPAMFFCQTHWVGFKSKDNSGRILSRNLEYCRNSLQKQQIISTQALLKLQQQAVANQMINFSYKHANDLSAVILASLLDAFSPCNWFFIIAFLAFLWLHPWEFRQELILGISLCLILVVIHFIQGHYTYLVNSGSILWRICNVIMGFLLCNMVAKQHNARYAAMLTALAGMVLIYLNQQSCQYNLLYMFEQSLSLQPLAQSVRIAYECLYQFCYVIPLLVVLLIWMLLHRCAFAKRLLPRYEILARAFLLCTGVLLIIYPHGLSVVTVFYAVAAVTGIATVWFSKISPKSKNA